MKINRTSEEDLAESIGKQGYSTTSYRKYQQKVDSHLAIRMDTQALS